MSRKLLVILLVFGLLVGNLAYAPVVSAASYSFGGAAYGNLILGATDAAVFVYSSTEIVWSGSRIDASSPGAYQWTTASNYGVGSVLVDGVERDNTNGTVGCGFPGYIDVLYLNSSPYTIVNARVRVYNLTSGTHTISWYGSGTLVGHTYSVSGSVAAYDDALYGVGGENPMGDPGVGVWPTLGPPLSVTIAGPSAVDTTVGGTWTATAAGGTSPYTYLWSYGLTSGFPTNATTHYGSTLSVVLAPGTNTVQVTAADAADPAGDAVDSVSVVSADQVASYHILLQRVGSVGQYVEATAWDNTGQPVEITGTADSEIGIYYVAPDPVGFNWSAIDEAYAVVGSWAWRWSIWGGIQHEWFKSTITITGGHVISVIAEFVGTGQNLDIWVSPDDIQINPPVPPGVEEVEPDWVKTGKEILNWFLEQIKALLKILFVPTATDFSSQLASGWVVITSPVPSITPQYTIPFPNPNHLLAPTGDSVNIDFSVVQEYAGYSIMHTIVQVLMYAILVFIALGIVT